MKIIIFDGTFKTTTFINRLVSSLSDNHEVSIIGFNEEITNKLQNVSYVSLGSNHSDLSFLKTSIKLRGFNIKQQIKLFSLLLKGKKRIIKEENLQLVANKIQPEIIHFQWVSVLSYLKNLKLPKHTKTILSQRGYHINVRPFINQDNKVFLNEVFSKLDGFHSVSNAIQKKSNEIYTSPLKIDRVVYSGFDEDLFRFKNTWNTNKKIQILSIGRDHWVKDYRTSLLTMSILKKNKISFHYTVVGINKSEELLFLVNELNLSDKVTFIDKIPQEEVYEKMLTSDIFLLPSVEEGIANVCIEAMLSKLPVLSTDCGGMSELISDTETGFLVPTRSPESIANKIEIFSEMQTTEIIKMVNKAYDKAKLQHNNQQMVDNMLSLYEKVYENN